MPIQGPIPPRWAPYTLSLLRIMAAFLFMAHGSQKLFAVPAGAEAVSRVPLGSLMGVAGILEFFGGLLMLVGLFTRPVGFLLCGFMAVAYFNAHAPAAFWPILNHGELAVLYSFVWLHFAAAGGGPWSLDAILGRGRAAR